MTKMIKKVFYIFKEKEFYVIYRSGFAKCYNKNNIPNTVYRFIETHQGKSNSERILYE